MTRFALAAVLTLTASAETPGTISLSVPDVVLRDQNGDRVKVWSELIRGKVVVMNFVFTSCTTICSPMGAHFGELQKHVGSDVRLISVTIDPETDTPARLKKWSRQFRAGSSWTLLTGEHEDVEQLLKALGVYTPNRFNHGPVLLVGDGRSGRWVRANGLAAPADVIAMIGRLRTAAPATAERTRR